MKPNPDKSMISNEWHHLRQPQKSLITVKLGLNSCSSCFDRSIHIWGWMPPSVSSVLLSLRKPDLSLSTLQASLNSYRSIFTCCCCYLCKARAQRKAHLWKCHMVICRTGQELPVPTAWWRQMKLPLFLTPWFVYLGLFPGVRRCFYSQ